jgi:hypothetical protein
MITIHDRHGKPLNAMCSVAGTPTGCEITFECRGGTKGTSNARNLEYMDGLDAVLRRLASLQAVLVDAFLDTKTTTRLGLSLEDRRLIMPAFAFPVVLSHGLDLVRLRNELCAAQRPIGRTADAKGAGNNTKRFSVVCEWGSGGAPVDLSVLALGNGIANEDNQDESPGMQPPAAQGRGLSTPEKRAVEQHAMRMVAVFLSREWPIVTDISRTEPCDLLCQRGSDQLWVEVKGTTGRAGKVIVTRNEVIFAREHHPDTALCVVHGIHLSADPEDPKATGGSILVERPWHPADERLIATQFEYVVSPSDADVRAT